MAISIILKLLIMYKSTKYAQSSLFLFACKKGGNYCSTLWPTCLQAHWVPQQCQWRSGQTSRNNKVMYSIKRTKYESKIVELHKSPNSKGWIKFSTLHNRRATIRNKKTKKLEKLARMHLFHFPQPNFIACSRLCTIGIHFESIDISFILVLNLINYSKNVRTIANQMLIPWIVIFSMFRYLF